MTLKQCAAFRPDGERCKRAAREGSEYCHSHRRYVEERPARGQPIIILEMVSMNELEQLRAKRLELIKNIAVTADQIAALDCEIEAIQMNLLEEDLNRQQEAVA